MFCVANASLRETLFWRHVLNTKQGRGNFINGQWVIPAQPDARIMSADPANQFNPVFSVETAAASVDDAVEAASVAYPRWFALSQDERLHALESLAAAFQNNVEEMAKAIVYETGKPHREALGEAKSLAARIRLMADKGLKRIAPLAATSVPGATRAHPQGVLSVIGPYNYPAHLLNAHVIPALMTGNTIVAKPSEYCPLTGEMYARCMEESELPPGVFNMVQGARDVGEALASHPETHGVLFTGSYQTGRAIQQACADQPHKIVALEMGGKNTALILEDASLSQALAAVLQGAYLTAGQRCTATSRVLVHRRMAQPFMEALAAGARKLIPGDPWKAETPFGPLANKLAFERFVALRASAKKLGYEPIVPGEIMPGGAFVTPSVHMMTPESANKPGYIDEELFGPDLCVEIIDDLDHGISRMKDSPYGLSNAVFTANKDSFEKVFRETRSGLLNLNKSTNGASGELPFGGVGKSGNQRPAGIDAMRYATFPVAIVEEELGAISVDATFQIAFQKADALVDISIPHLLLRQELEKRLELYGVFCEDVDGAAITLDWGSFINRIPKSMADGGPILEQLGAHARKTGSQLVIEVPHPTEEPAEAMALFAQIEEWLQQNAAEDLGARASTCLNAVSVPAKGRTPRSDAMLRRMYKNEFVPRERKTPVVDLGASSGAYLQSIDAEPLSILDAASQIASLGLGFRAGAFLNGLDDGGLIPSLLANANTGDDERAACDAYRAFLCERAWSGITHASFTAGGAEANEKAFDLCRQNGPGGRRIIAFEGSFHGRTLMSLHATYNPVKRAPFEFTGHEVSFVPFPAWTKPVAEPQMPEDWIQSWHGGSYLAPLHDALIRKEVDILTQLAASIDEGDVCAVIIEPMQGEGGDNYATARFFQGLRALTRGKGVPLVFDEVQTGFGLGDTFFWHTQFDLRDVNGAPDGPDCITLAKKAQVGVCLSSWSDSRQAVPHIAQVKRGLIHAQEIDLCLPWSLSSLVSRELSSLVTDHPLLVSNPRSQGFAFAFDLPTQHLAMQIIKQRFYRGFMAYIAGQKTVRFRLNAAWGRVEIERIFQSIREALQAIIESSAGLPIKQQDAAMGMYQAPDWIDSKDETRSKRREVKRVAQAYFHRRDQGPQLLHWLVSLPEEALYEFADRILGVAGQLSDEDRTRLFETFLEDRWTPEWTPEQIKEKCAQISLDLEQAPNSGPQYDAICARLKGPVPDILLNAYGTRLSRITKNEWERFKNGVMRIENETYEDGRRETEDELKTMVEAEGGYCLVAHRRQGTQEHVLGYAFGGPLENFNAQGPDRDCQRGKKNTFYSGNMTVAQRARGLGLGTRMKNAQMRFVQNVKLDDGQWRYTYLTGRNRWGNTPEMQTIHQKMGSYTALHLREGQYGEKDGQAVYYRIPMRRPEVSVSVSTPTDLDWSSSVQAPLGRAHPRLVEAVRHGYFTNAVGTKLTLSNWVTPDLVRYTEVLRRLAPRDLGHMYFTSGQSELVDKGLRCLRVKRPKGQIVFGLRHQYLGSTTAAARSLTESSGEATPHGWFDWPLLPHPEDVGEEEALAALSSRLRGEPAESVLALVLELVGEKSGLVLSPSYWEKATALCRERSIPVVAVETASSLGRVGNTLFHADSLETAPDMVWWYTGGQLGHIFVGDNYYVEKPLTLISTWDGDEISVVRNRIHLLEAQDLLQENRAQRFQEMVQASCLPMKGAGLWWSLQLDKEEEAEELRERAKVEGLILGRGEPGCIIISPPISVDESEWKRGLLMLEKCWKARELA
jgi:succinylglutamic semialdehyde dehydrogenase